MRSVSSISPLEQWAHLPANKYNIPGFLPVGTATQALTANVALVFPFYSPLKLHIVDARVVRTSAAAGGNIRAGLYEWNHEDRTGGALIKDLGTVAANATGAAAFTAGQPIREGWHALVLVSDDAPTIRLTTGHALGQQNDFGVATNDINGVTHYTADGTGWVAGGMGAALGTLTPILSTSSYLKNMGVIFDTDNNPAIF